MAGKDSRYYYQRKVAQVAFVLEEFKLVSRARDPSTSRYRSGIIQTAMLGDDAVDRIERFKQAFPAGRKKETSCESAYKRLKLIMNDMVEAGALTRSRIGVQKQHLGDSSGWCYDFRLNEELLSELKYDLKTAEELAEEIAPLL